jgi:hypothetical protein
MFRRPTIFLVAALSAGFLACAEAQAQTLIYALSYANTPADLHSRFPTGALGASTADKLAMLRRFRKTEIYSYSTANGERKLLFSDEGSNFEIEPTGPVLGQDTAYVVGVMREWRTGPTPGAYSDPSALYEIHLDRSKRWRKLEQTQPNQTPAVPNLQGNKAAIESTLNDQYVISVYEVPAWKLLSRWELGQLTRKYCPDCLPMSFGWLSGDRLFFDLDLGDEDSIDEKHHNVPGVYVMSVKGEDLGSFSPRIPKTDANSPSLPEGAGQRLLAELANRDYLFEQCRTSSQSHARPECFLVVSGADSAKERRFPIHPRFPASTRVAPSGKFIAFFEDRTTPQYRSERHVWVMELQSGKETEVYVAAPPGPPTALEPNIIVSILGWAEEKR